MQRVKHRTFVPIGIDEYIQRHVRSNAEEKPDELRARLRLGRTVRGALSVRHPIWVIGSADDRSLVNGFRPHAYDQVTSGMGRHGF